MDKFLEILLEKKAPTQKTTKLKVDPDDSTDYSADDNGAPSPDDEPTPDSDEATSQPDDTASTDYTLSAGQADPNDDGATPDDSTDDTASDTGDDGESTDYTSDDNGAPSPDDDADPNATSTDTPADGTDPTATDNPDDPSKDNELENSRILMDDFVKMYYTVRSTQEKLTGIDKSNIFINKIVSQVSSNLDKLEEKLHDYIIFGFSKSNYVTNLYKYSSFIESVRINIEMLKKISVFVPNAQNN